MASMIMMTTPVTAIILNMLLSAASVMSVVSAAGPVTYALIPSGGGEESTILRTASTDWFPSVLPWLPATLSWT